MLLVFFWFFFFFNDTATTEIYTLSLHDALPISMRSMPVPCARLNWSGASTASRSEEHTSELQSRENIVCSLLLEKKKKKKQKNIKTKKKRKKKKKEKPKTNT